MTKVNIDILMSVYNGSNYIEEQIDSILGQTYNNWLLIFRDDGSTDNSVEIIKGYQHRYAAKIQIILDREREKNVNFGACQSFGQILIHSKARYAMFCDQDDVWLPTKIEKTLQCMEKLESIYQPSTPILVHTDLAVVDQNLFKVSDSFWKYQRLSPANSLHLNRLLIQNSITGCTVMINQRLREMAVPVPPEAIMHDYWLGLVAAAFGKIAYLNKSTILYRQHGLNDLGARKYDWRYILKRSGQASPIRNELKKKQRQTEIFYQHYREYLAERPKALLEDFLVLGEKGYWQNRWLVVKNQFFPSGLARNFGLFLYL